MTAPFAVPAAFDLPQTLDCGQAFRWKEVPGEDGHSWWQGGAGNRFLRLRREGDLLLLSCSPGDWESFWKGYFDFDEDYAQKRELLAAASPVLREAASFAPGIRILRQDPWEALCSFLISQNNNIPRIKGIIKALCTRFGEPVADGAFYAFPTPEALAGLSPEDLAPLRAGYRAGYLIDAGQKISENQIDMEKVKNSPADFGREELQKIAGVGPKVAECVLLYGFHKMECFPMDVWMKRAMAVLLPGFSPQDFGENAGLAQQLLFHYSRNHPELFAAAPA